MAPGILVHPQKILVYSHLHSQAPKPHAVMSRGAMHRGRQDYVIPQTWLGRGEQLLAIEWGAHSINSLGCRTSLNPAVQPVSAASLISENFLG